MLLLFGRKTWLDSPRAEAVAELRATWPSAGLPVRHFYGSITGISRSLTAPLYGSINGMHRSPFARVASALWPSRMREEGGQVSQCAFEAHARDSKGCLGACGAVSVTG